MISRRGLSFARAFHACLSLFTTDKHLGGHPAVFASGLVCYKLFEVLYGRARAHTDVRDPSRHPSAYDNTSFCS